MTKKKFGGLALSAALLFASAAHAADEARTLTHQGVERRYTIVGRKGTEPQPLIVALHGLGQTIADLRGQLRLDPVAARYGFIAAYPEAVDRTWNYGRPLATGTTVPTVDGAPADDIGFLRALIAALLEAKQADAARIYVTGVSRGGLLAFTAACALADQIAAAAPLITGMTDLQREDCKPARPVAMIVLAGTNDRAQSYDGALTARGRLLSVPETMEFWRGLHGCTSQEWRLLTHRDATDPTQVTVVDWGACASKQRVRLYRVEGGGHQVPSLIAATPDQEKRFGSRNRDFDTAEELWAVFKELKR